MLEELRIRGLGVIDEATLPLGPGLTVVTGETGAGKTMVVTGLLLLYGARADSARVRTGAGQASVDGRLAVGRHPAVIERVLAAGGAVDREGGSGGRGGGDGGSEDVELVLRRVVTSAGRSRAYVGGTAAPVSVLGELADHLVAVHGQADQQHLVRPSAQRAALDRFAGVDLTEFTAAYTTWRTAEARLAERRGRAAELRRETDLLAHGLREIESVGPRPGEDAELARESARLAHADGLTLAATVAHHLLLGNPDDPATEAADVVQLLGSALRGLAQQHGDDVELDALAARLTELSSLAADLGADLRDYADAIDADPARLDEVERRRAGLQSLVRKYCDEAEPSVDGVLRWAQAAAARLTEIDVSDEAFDALRDAREVAASRVAERSEELSALRTAAAARLGRSVTAELAGLAMADARMQIEVRPRAAAATTLRVAGREVGVGPDGADEIEFLLQPHPDAPALAIGRGASGGELSRIMLALEVCLAGADPVPTLVFDEVDAGVGGRAAVEVGRRLARLARRRQVLVVTHLAQVAAFADRHVVVDGASARGVRASDVRVVDGAARIDELARMLAGSATATAREHAAELLAAAASARSASEPAASEPPAPEPAAPETRVPGRPGRVRRGADGTAARARARGTGPVTAGS